MESNRSSSEEGTRLKFCAPRTLYLAVLKCHVVVLLLGTNNVRVKGGLEASDSEICPPPPGSLTVQAVVCWNQFS